MVVGRVMKKVDLADLDPVDYPRYFDRSATQR
jgi:hypothetical protein